MAESPPSSSAAADGLPKPRRFVAIGAISFGTALVVIDGAIATVALPTIARRPRRRQLRDGADRHHLQLVLVMTLLPFSALGDRVGHRRLYQYGQAVFTIATILCFFAKSLPFLLVVRAVQALGAAAALSVSQAMIRSIYPSNHLGRGIGVNSVVVSISGALAPTLGRRDPGHRALAVGVRRGGAVRHIVAAARSRAARSDPTGSAVRRARRGSYAPPPSA